LGGTEVIDGVRGIPGWGRLSLGVGGGLLFAGVCGVTFALEEPTEDLSAAVFLDLVAGEFNVVGVWGPFELVGEDRADMVRPLGECVGSFSSIHSKCKMVVFVAHYGMEVK
jgi:hypothetical protein